jgi:hypothetical protein
MIRPENEASVGFAPASEFTPHEKADVRRNPKRWLAALCWGGAAAGLGFVLADARPSRQHFPAAAAAHHPGENCLACHGSLKAAGTVFKDAAGAETSPGASVIFIAPDGAETSFQTNGAGNLAATGLADGSYLLRLNAVTSRTWHVLPGQASCNVCHIQGGNGSATRTRTLHPYHTRLPPDNDCRGCHHFPASQSYDRLKTTGVLNGRASDPSPPSSRVDILGRVFEFDPAQYVIRTTRPDVFAPGYFSMFDVILAVAKRNGIPISYRFDLKSMTYFISRIDGRSGNYWYRFSYDAGSGNAQELSNRRANRWDEALWRPGVWVKVVEGETLDEIKTEYLDEIARERTLGHVIPEVRISVNPSNYLGNPPGSGRITVSRTFSNVRVTPHDWRATGYLSVAPKPFRPGVVTSLDILLSLQDQGALDVVTGMFYTYFAGHSIQSYYVVGLGFPGVGTAHASGRQGFVYTTENGTPNRLPNNADSKLHLTCDIHVIHAPDFSSWRWAELGNPYYESQAPAFDGLLAESVKDDFEAVGRGFNLHQPVVRKDRLEASFNLFEPARVRLEVKRAGGKAFATLFEGEVGNIGVQKLRWDTKGLAPGTYELLLTCRASTQTRTFDIPGR